MREMKIMDLVDSKYDYIIAGSGCAGLSILYKILKTPSLQYKSILVIDQNLKTSINKTWCFWEKKSGDFDTIVHTKWKSLEVLSDNYKKNLELGPYIYKMIRGIDFYNFIINHAKKFKNITFIEEDIISMSYDKNAILKTLKNTYISDYIFNSTNLFNPEFTLENSLLQHFKGWIIKTEKSEFNSDIGRIMDFGLTQKDGATFMYLLPISQTEALVEYTIFSPKILDNETYELEIKKYISEKLSINNYIILNKESGIIPMSLAKFEKNPKKNIYNIGTAGGFTKASTGYTFPFIQKNVTEIVKKLEKGEKISNSSSFKDSVYEWYDRTLIDVLLKNKLSGKEVFTKMFKNIPAYKIFAFLGNESTFSEDLSIMKKMPLTPFFISGINQLKFNFFKKIFATKSL
ncbi:lycopene cyclase family protein [bacterium]|nr:lycopene cyclase family protein [bacterium]